MNIHQILNTALMEGVDEVNAAGPKSNKYTDALQTATDTVKNTGRKVRDAAQPYVDQAGKAVSDATDKAKGFYNTHEEKFKNYGPAALVALGAGIGAVALAKKLRNRKAAAKQA